MAAELQIDLSQTAQTVYFLIRSSVGQVWNTNTAALENYNTSHYANYAIAATEQGTASGFYVATFPTGITTTGVYSVVAKIQSGGSPAETDTSVGWGDQYWDGTNLLTNYLPANFEQLVVSSTGRVSILTGFTKGVAVPDFSFVMVKPDGVTPATGLTVTATRSIDGAAFAACANAVSELGNGYYLINLASSDLNGGVISLRFTATGAVNRDITVRTDP